MLNSAMETLLALPIPPLAVPAPVPTLQECGEPLLPIPDNLPGVCCRPEYHRQGVAAALATCFVRAGVLERLEQLGRRLRAWERMLVVWDAWRPVEVQQALYDGYQAVLRQQHPQWTEAELETQTREFVALPSFDPVRPSPHLTGGALDVTLADPAGNLLPMGTDYDDFSPVAATHYFETLHSAEAVPAHSPNTPDAPACRANRRLLYHIMREAGFTNYEAEWWHFDWGNRLWSRQTGRAPFYGAVLLSEP